MTYPLTAQALVTTVRKRIEDRNSASFDNAEILGAADQALQAIYTDIRNTMRDHETDRVALALSDFTNPEQYVYEYVLPEWVAAVRELSGTYSNAPSQRNLVTFPRAEIDWRRAVGGPSWTMVGDRPGTIRIFGNLSRFSAFTLYFERRWAPLHWGTAQGASSQSQLQFASAPTGTVIQRAGLYVGMDVVLTNDTPAGNLDALRRITAYAGGSTREITVASNWPATPTSATTYSLVVPLAQEHTSLLIYETSRVLLEELGEVGQLTVLMGQIERERAKMVESAAARDKAAPRIIWNHGG